LKTRKKRSEGGLTLEDEVRLDEDVNEGKGGVSQRVVAGDPRNVEDERDARCNVKIGIFCPFAVFS